MAALPPHVPALIRSTVPPGTTDRIAAARTGLVCHAPEFMHERAGGAWAESADVPFLILGGTPGARGYFRFLLAGFFPKIHECDAVTAELAKYVINLHLATRVTFINEMDAICRAVGADWEDVRQAWLCDPRITPEYTGGIAEFGPGFGGRCWPKDLAALIHAARGAGYEPGFLEAVQSANGRFRG
jgi:UDPglucose 6-dehydrogenase